MGDHELIGPEWRDYEHLWRYRCSCGWVTPWNWKALTDYAKVVAHKDHKIHLLGLAHLEDRAAGNAVREAIPVVHVVRQELLDAAEHVAAAAWLGQDAHGNALRRFDRCVARYVAVRMGVKL